jgi:cytochrome c-type biogenesis protein CcmH
MFRLFRSRWAQAAMVCCLVVVMLGAGDTSEERYDRVGHNMMCACGCGQILLECNHVSCPSSGPMTIELKQQMAAGGSDKAILDWFVAKYGATVLAAPLRGGFDDVAWITPIALFLLAILGTALIIRVWKSRSIKHVPVKIAGMTPSKTDELRERIRRETHY